MFVILGLEYAGIRWMSTKRMTVYSFWLKLCPVQKLTNIVTMRLDDALNDRLEAMNAAVKINKAEVLRACVEALLDHFEAHGSISFPIRVVPAGKK